MERAVAHYKLIFIEILFEKGYGHPTVRSLPRLRVVVQVRGVAVGGTPASALSPPLSLFLLSSSLPPLHRALAQNVQD